MGSTTSSTPIATDRTVEASCIPIKMGDTRSLVLCRCHIRSRPMARWESSYSN